MRVGMLLLAAAAVAARPQRATSHAAPSVHPLAACAALALPPRRAASGNNDTRREHDCFIPDSLRQLPEHRAWRPTTVLLLVPSAYTEIVPGWAVRVRAANASCAVAGARSACEMAKRAGCRCLAPTTRP